LHRLPRGSLGAHLKGKLDATPLSFKFKLHHYPLSASVDDLEVERYLLSDDAGERLQAYAFLYAKPRASALGQLVKTVTSGLEPYPFSQYWGIRSIGRILETVDSKTVSASVKRELSTFCNQVSTDTDRHFELSKIAEALGFEC
jgi:hypothetical protein